MPSSFSPLCRHFKEARQLVCGGDDVACGMIPVRNRGSFAKAIASLRRRRALHNPLREGRCRRGPVTPPEPARDALGATP